MTYLLDANVFIQAKNLHYGFDFCPAFWSWLDQEHAAENVFSIESIRDELRAATDELSTWSGERDPFFLKPDATIVASLQATSTWATGAGYDPAAVNTFLQVGDYYLVAHAHAHGFTVVTHEIAQNSVKKVKIPDACMALGVKCVTPYAMLRSERARFVLGGIGLEEPVGMREQENVAGVTAKDLRRMMRGSGTLVELKSETPDSLKLRLVPRR